MATPLCFYAQFVASKAGKDALAPTWDIEQITRSTGARSALVTAGATNITVGRRGLYGYCLSDSDLSLYDYLVTAITSDATVDQKEVSAVWTLFNIPSSIQTGDSFARIGPPVALDSGAATIAAMLTKMADDNGGASFDATVSSLNKLSTAVVTGVAATLQALANTETTGTLISGTYTSTYLSNGTSWVTAPVTPAVAEAGSALSPFGLNVNLRYTAATGQTINSVSIRGNFAAGAGRYCNVYAYNYITTSWDMLSDVGTRMNNTNTLTTYTYTLLAAHQKTDAGGDGVGAIRIGFKSPSVTTGDRLNVDLCLVNVATAGPSAADIADAVYAKMATSVYGRQVWIDTVNGVDGYVIGVNGLDHTPVLTIACAYQLCDDLGLKTIAFKSGSNTVAVTLTRSAAGYRFYGPGKINLNGQSIADAIFEECYSVYGTSVGDDASFYRCQLASTPGITLDHAYLTACRLKGAITMIANADPLILHDCIDATAAAVDFDLIFVANASAIIRNFQGALTLKNMAATNSIVIDGALRVTIDATCTAGSITVRGFAPALTGAAAFVAAGGTITQDARYSVDAINAEVDTALADVNLDHLVGTATGIPALPAGTFLDGPIKSDLVSIMGTALTGTAAWIAGAFKKFFNIETPTGTINSIPGALPGAATGLTIMPAVGYQPVDVASWMNTEPLALSNQQVQAVVPVTQKVDVETIKTKPVTVDVGGTTFPASVGTSTYAGGAVAGVTGVTFPATVPAAGDVADAVLDEAKGTHSGHLASIPTNPYTGTPPTADDVAAKILVTPANKLATDGTGRVTPDTVTAAAPSTDDIKTKLEENGGKLDHLWEMTEDDGGVRRLTANALEESPASTGTPQTGDAYAVVTNATYGNSALHADIALIAGVAGAGSETVVITCNDGTNPIEGVAVWVTSDVAGTNVVAGTLYSNTLGKVTLYLDAGTYQVFKQGGANWTNPTQIVVVDA